MASAYHYQNSFKDELASEFRDILSVPFQPTHIPNLVAWFEADDTNTITKDGSDKVSQWDDKSGQGNHAKQGTAVKQPTYVANGVNGKPALYSDGNNRILTFSHPIKVDDPYTVFLTLKADIVTSDPTTGSSLNVALAFGEATSTNSAFSIRQTRTTPDVLRTSAYLGGSIFNSGNDDAVLSTTIYDGINVKTYKNGSLIDSDIASSPGMLITGGYILNDNTSGQRSFIGWVSDIVIYRDKLTDEHLAQVEQYLISKYV